VLAVGPPRRVLGCRGLVSLPRYVRHGEVPNMPAHNRHYVRFMTLRSAAHKCRHVRVAVVLTTC